MGPGDIIDAIQEKLFADSGTDYIEALSEVYTSFISPKIDDYNSSVYYETPSYLFECFKEKKML